MSATAISFKLLYAVLCETTQEMLDLIGASISDDLFGLSSNATHVA